MKTTEDPQHAQDNVQEDALNDVGDVLNQIAPYWRSIVGVVVVAVTGIALFGFIANNRKKAEERSWAEYFEAVDNRNPQALQELAQNGSGSVVPWAYQAAAQGRLAEGMQSLYTDREQARSALEESASAFESAVAASEGIPLLNQRSMWGFAQAQEGLNELEKAKDAYQKLLDRWPESPLAKRAQERIASLNEPETQEFYRWFFDQKPSVSAGSPFDTTPEETFTIPDEPDVTIPEISIPGEEDTEADSPTAEPSANDDSVEADATNTSNPVSTDLEEIAEESDTEESETESVDDSANVEELIESEDDPLIEVNPDP